MPSSLIFIGVGSVFGLKQPLPTADFPVADDYERRDPLLIRSSGPPGMPFDLFYPKEGLRFSRNAATPSALSGASWSTVKASIE